MCWDAVRYAVPGAGSVPPECRSPTPQAATAVPIASATPHSWSTFIGGPYRHNKRRADDQSDVDLQPSDVVVSGDRPPIPGSDSPGNRDLGRTFAASWPGFRSGRCRGGRRDVRLEPPRLASARGCRPDPGHCRGRGATECERCRRVPRCPAVRRRSRSGRLVRVAIAAARSRRARPGPGR